MKLSLNVKRRKRQRPRRRLSTPQNRDIDPSRTTSLRKRIQHIIRKQIKTLLAAVRELIVKEDAFGLKRRSSGMDSILRRESTNAFILTNTRWSHLTPAQKALAFQRWLKAVTELINFQVNRELDDVIDRAYEKGGERSYTEVNKKEVNKELRESGATPVNDETRKTFIRTEFNRPVAQHRVELIKTRAFTDIQGITQEMSSQMSKALTDGFIAGDSPRKLVTRLVEITGKSRSKAETIARTEVVRAHAEGQLIGLEALGVEEVGVAVEWSTAGDDRVCSMCQPLQGVILKLKEAKGMLPRHPNCRCAWIPANVGESQQDQQRTKTEVKTAIRRSVKAETSDDSSGWTGADKSIAEKRPQSNV